MICTRRGILETIFTWTIVASVPLSAFKYLSPAQVKAAVGDPKVRWGFVVDTTKCVGWGFCVKACKKENEVPYDIPVSRIWVERYVIDRKGKAHIDSPLA